MNLWQSISGIVELTLISADPEGAITAITGQGITLFCVISVDNLTLRLRISRRHLSLLRMVCRKRGDMLKVNRRLGLCWAGLKILRRPVMVAGLLSVVAGTLILPTRILFVEIEGNQNLPLQQILETAESAGLHFGTLRREIRSEKIKNILLERIPELQWVGVNSSGCRAVISLKERQPEVASVSSGYHPIVAARDGVILSCTVTGGSALCSPGQAVTAGQALISPYTDCGISIRVEPPNGEVFAQTRRSITVKTPEERRLQGDVLEQTRRYSLIIGKKRINFWKGSGIWDATCDRIYEEYYLTLPGGFRLPVKLAVDTFLSRQICTDCRSREAVSESLDQFASSYVSGQMVAGQVLLSQQVLTLENGFYRMDGVYACREMIGRVSTKQIGEINE